MVLSKVWTMLVVVSIALSGCGAAVPVAIDIATTAIEVAPIIVPVAIDVSSKLSARSAVDPSAPVIDDWMADVDLAFSHAAEKHGESTAETIRRLCNNGSVLRTYQTDKERYVQICKVDEKQYGCRVVDLVDTKWYEVTAFVKSCFTGRSLRDIDEYAQKKFWAETNVRVK